MKHFSTLFLVTKREGGVCPKCQLTVSRRRGGGLTKRSADCQQGEELSYLGSTATCIWMPPVAFFKLNRPTWTISQYLKLENISFSDIPTKCIEAGTFRILYLIKKYSRNGNRKSDKRPFSEKNFTSKFCIFDTRDVLRPKLLGRGGGNNIPNF